MNDETRDVTAVVRELRELQSMIRKIVTVVVIIAFLGGGYWYVHRAIVQDNNRTKHAGDCMANKFIRDTEWKTGGITTPRLADCP